MKLKLALFGMLVALLTGCSSDDNMLSVNENLSGGEVGEVATSQNIKAIAKYIGRHHRTVSRSTETLLSPYVVDGDTVMYIANYGEGWEVFSNDPRVPMVLMKSDSGNFYPTALDNESPFDALFQNTAQYLSSVKNEDFAPTDTINSEWMAYGIKTLGVDDPEDSNKYYWKNVGYSEHNHQDTCMPYGGRLKTKWHQDGTFKSYTPIIGNEHTKVGCTAVAIGQYLYFTHYKDNRPEKTVTNAVYDSKNNSYIFSGSSSTIWDLFTDTEAYMPYAEPTAIFLGWVAQKIKTKFGLQSSSAQAYSTSLTFFKEQTGLNASQSKYSRYSVKEILEKGYPVFITACTAEDECHAWLIDYYESDWTIYNDYYIYVKRTEGPNPDEEDDYDINDMSIDRIKALYGDVEIDIRSFSVDKTYLMFNWGWDSYYFDNIKYDANIPSWVGLNGIFSTDHYIYYFK
ncbi:MAG: hypothetical protein HDS44_01350 [Bacteroides sp.]|nr:hypothetical protein [Bacteroides sp.]